MATSWTTPATQTSGTVLTAAWLNTEVRDHLAWLGTDKPSCRLTHSTTQVVASATEVALNLNTEIYKSVSSMHNTVTNNTRLVFPVTGTYLVGGSVAFSATANSDGRSSIRLNGANKIAIQNTRDQFAIAITAYRFTATDYIELVAYQVSTGSLNSVANADYSPLLWAYWIGT